MRTVSKAQATWTFRLFLAAYLLLSLWNWSTFRGSSKTDDLTKPGLQQPRDSQNSNNNNNNNNNNNKRGYSNPLEELSSVDYYACCGLGHRLIRMSNAYFLARQRNFSFRAFWGWCGERQPIEVFNYLFRPYMASEVAHVTSRNLLMPFYNDVGGFYSLTRTGSSSDHQATTTTTTTANAECPCLESKAQSDLELYTSLRQRFRQRNIVEDFVQTHFKENFVIGLHVRAGNGETGDFVNKGRGIEDPNTWVGHVVGLIRDFQRRHLLPSQSVVLYIATDTPSMITMFRDQLQQDSPVILVFDLPQSRPEEGQGVLFGEAIAVHNKDNNTSNDDDYSDCLKAWMDTMTDMFLLSHADVVFAGKPSSFSQTLPMSLAFGENIAIESSPKIQTEPSIPVYCEVIPHHEAIQEHANNTTTTTWVEVAPTMQCYHSYMEWCCNYSTWIRFRHTGPKGRTKVVSREFIQFPRPEIANTVKDLKVMRNRTANCPRPGRGRAAGGRKDKCLPHEW
jgi:hypothetical protein